MNGDTSVTTTPTTTKVDSKFKAILDHMNPEGHALDDRASGAVAKAMLDEMYKPPLAPAQLAGYVHAGVKGLAEGATLGVLNLPDIEDETPPQRLFRGIGSAIGSFAPWSRALTTAKAVGLGVKGMALTGAAAETAMLATRKITLDEEISPVGDIVAIGLSSLFFGLAGRAKAAELLSKHMAREPLGDAVRFARPHTTWTRLNPEGFMEEDRELIRGFNAFHENLPPEGIDYDGMLRVANMARSGKAVPENWMVTPLETPKLRSLADGLTPSETEGALKDYIPDFGGYGELSKSPWTQVVPQRGVKIEKPPEVGKGVPVKESRAAAEIDATPASTIEAAIKRMEAALEPTSVEVQTATRSGAKEVRPLTNEEKDLALAQAARGERPKASSGTGEYERIIVTPRGDVMSEAQALARRGPAKTSHTFEESLGLRAKEIEHRKGVWLRTYEDAKGNEIGRAFYLKRGEGPEGAPEYFPSDAALGDVLVVEWSHAPKWSQSVMMRIRHDLDPKYLYAPEVGVSRMSRHRLGAKRIEGSDVVRFENVGRRK